MEGMPQYTRDYQHTERLCWRVHVQYVWSEQAQALMARSQAGRAASQTDHSQEGPEREHYEAGNIRSHDEASARPHVQLVTSL